MKRDEGDIQLFLWDPRNTEDSQKWMNPIWHSFQPLSLHTSKWFHYTLSLSIYSLIIQLHVWKYTMHIFSCRTKEQKHLMNSFFLYHRKYCFCKKWGSWCQKWREWITWLTTIVRWLRGSLVPLSLYILPLLSSSKLIPLVNDYGKEWNKCACLHCVENWMQNVPLVG